MSGISVWISEVTGGIWLSCSFTHGSGLRCREGLEQPVLQIQSHRLLGLSSQLRLST